MRTVFAAIIAIACSSSSVSSDKTTPFEGFTVSPIAAGRGIAVTTQGAGTVHIDRYPTGPHGPTVGTAVLVYHPVVEPQVLEALDDDGDGYWNAVRYMAKRHDGLVWVEDNDGDGVIDSTTPVKDPPESISIPMIE